MPTDTPIPAMASTQERDAPVASGGAGAPAAERMPWWSWLFTLACVVVLMPLLHEHFQLLWTRPYYRWAPLLVVGVAVALVVQWRKGLRPQGIVSHWVDVAGYAVLFLLMAVTYLYFTGWLAIVSAIWAVGLLLLQINRGRHLEHAFGMWALSFLLVRLPYQIEGRMLRALEGLSAQVASVILEWRKIYHVIQAQDLFLNDLTVGMQDITSGYFSIYTVVLLAGMLVVWKRRPLVHSMAMLACAAIVVVLVNGLRIAIVAGYAEATGSHLMESGWHWALLAFSVLISIPPLLSFDAFFTFLFSGVQEEFSSGKVERNLLVRLWDWACGFSTQSLSWMMAGEHAVHRQARRLLPYVAGLGTLLITVFASVILYYEWTADKQDRTKFMHRLEDLKEVDPEVIRVQRPGWELIRDYREEREFSSLWGQFSHVWIYKYKDLVVPMALDYPFDKWHDVKTCYSNLGWQTETEEMAAPPSYQGWGASETTMNLPTGEHGYVLCSHMDHLGGQVQSKPVDHRFAMVMYYLHPKQWRAPFGQSTNKDLNTFYQTQVMVRSSFPLSVEERAEVRQAYGDFREQIRQQIEAMETR